MFSFKFSCRKLVKVSNSVAKLQRLCENLFLAAACVAFILLQTSSSIRDTFCRFHLDGENESHRALAKAKAKAA